MKDAERRIIGCRFDDVQCVTLKSVYVPDFVSSLVSTPRHSVRTCPEALTFDLRTTPVGNAGCMLLGDNVMLLTTVSHVSKVIRKATHGRGNTPTSESAVESNVIASFSLP